MFGALGINFGEPVSSQSDMPLKFLIPIAVGIAFKITARQMNFFLAQMLNGY
jgi:hypothetical protein